MNQAFTCMKTNEEFFEKFCELNRAYNEMVSSSLVELLIRQSELSDLQKYYDTLNESLSITSGIEVCRREENSSTRHSQVMDKDNRVLIKNASVSTEFSETKRSNRRFIKFVTIKQHHNFSFATTKTLNKVRRFQKSFQEKVKLRVRPDCIRKRIKSFLNSFVMKKLNGILRAANSTNFMYNPPKDLNIEISKTKNHDLLNSSIKNVFSLYPANPKSSSKVEHNKHIMSTVNLPSFQYELSRNLKDLYIEYTKSQQLKSDKEFVQAKEGDFYMSNFNKHIEDFLEHFGVN